MQKRRFSLRNTFTITLAFCAIVVFELIVLKGRITIASVVFNAEFVASVAFFTVVFRNIAVVQAWYPGVGRW